jgi:hypothetical protein
MPIINGARRRSDSFENKVGKGMWIEAGGGLPLGPISLESYAKVTHQVSAEADCSDP